MSPAMHINLNEPAWPDLADRDDVIHLQTDLSVSALEHGMESGAPSVAFRFDLPDGRPVIAETSLSLLATTAPGDRREVPAGALLRDRPRAARPRSSSGS